MAHQRGSHPPLTDPRSQKPPQPPPKQTARQDLCLLYELAASDIADPRGGELLFLCLFLFQALPQLAPRAAVEFLCKLGEAQVREVVLTNPGRRAVAYSARIEGGGGAFSLEAATAKADPGRAARLGVRCAPATAAPREALLVLQPRRDSGAPGAAVVFALRAAVRTRAPLRRVEVAAALYELVQFDVHVVNPFPAGERASLLSTAELNCGRGLD